jgi:methylated-DNA-protein-cysteine methyltransferase-like protein
LCCEIPVAILLRVEIHGRWRSRFIIVDASGKAIALRRAQLSSLPENFEQERAAMYFWSRTLLERLVSIQLIDDARAMRLDRSSSPRFGKSRIPADQLAREKAKRSLIRVALQRDEPRDIAFRRIILSIPPGKVSTYGRVAAAAGYPRLHRAVARLLRTDPPDQLPWHRVLGAGGEIKLKGAAAREQRARLKLEGVRFRGERVDMDRFEHALKPWEVYGGLRPD